MRSFWPYTLFVWALAVGTSIAGASAGYEFPQPIWTITIWGSWGLMIWSLFSKKRWLDEAR